MTLLFPELKPAADFESFWSAYPLKTKRHYAEQCFRRALKHAKAKDIVEGVNGYAAAMVGTDKKFIMHPSTFLNQRCWTEYSGTNAPNRYDTRAWERAGRVWLDNGKKGPAPQLEEFPRM